MPRQGAYEIMLEGDRRKGIKKRTATLEVRFSKVSICSHQYNDKSLPATKELYAIEARETTQGIENPIVWRLLTTWVVESLDAALLCIERYSCRWIIEEGFRILKKEGFNIEASVLSHGKAIRKLCLLMLETIIKLFLMQIAYAMPEEEVNPQSCFSEQQIACMEQQVTQLEGKTQN